MSRENELGVPRLPALRRGDRQNRPSGPCDARTAAQPIASPEPQSRPLNNVVSPSSQLSFDGQPLHLGAVASQSTRRDASSAARVSAGFVTAYSSTAVVSPASVTQAATKQEIRTGSACAVATRIFII